MLRYFFLFFLISTCVYSQYKYEKEFRVTSQDVPIKADSFIKMCPFSKKVKWYTEESQAGKSYEAKVYYKKHKHSIEFSESGELIDIEIKVKFYELPPRSQTSINSTFSSIFKKYKIEKTQIQYSGSESSIYKSIFNLKAVHEKTTINYELIIKGKKENSYFKYEFLLDQNGMILKELQFAPENADNLEF